jgi:hypothetical protein
MSGREIPPIGPDDESEDSVVDRLVIEDMRKTVDYKEEARLNLGDILVPLTEEELKEGHPALETLGTILESVQAHMAYFQVEDADRITVDQVQRLEPELYHNPLELEDLVLIVKNEMNQEDADSPLPSRLTFERIIETGNRIDMKKILNEETQKAVTNLTVRVFGQNQEENLFRKAIESPTLARKIRRFSWILNQPFMEEFPETVRRELAVRKYQKRLEGDSLPVSMNFIEVLQLANRTLRGKKIELDEDVLDIKPSDYIQLIANRMLYSDVLRAIAVSETVASTAI